MPRDWVMVISAAHAPLPARNGFARSHGDRAAARLASGLQAQVRRLLRTPVDG